MRITRVGPVVLRLPVVNETVDGTQDDLLIKIETDEGIYGWGIDVIQPDISRAGGLTETRKVGVLARDANIRLVPHGFKTGVLLTACLHLIAALAHCEPLEFSLVDSPLRRDLLLEPFRTDTGYVRVPEKPGLGIEVNPEVVAEYRVK
jgi:L-alanine-DL-glutamate epimerase-like enolase superfamily enzyme